MINTTPVSIGDLSSLLDTVYQLKLPLMIWSPPGYGKSDSLRQFTSLRNLILRDIRLTTFEPLDLRGLPWIDKENRETFWMRPDFFPVSDSRPGILFLDEITHVEPRMQGSAFQLVLDRQIGPHKLPDDWAVIAAGNRVEDGAMAYRMNSALADRFCHVQLTTNIQDWVAWAQLHEIHPAVISFLKTQPEFLTTVQGQQDVLHLVQPTPRSWERVSGILNQTSNSAIRNTLIEGLVGEATARVFTPALEEIEMLPAVESLLQMEPSEAAEKIPAVITALYGVIYSVVYYCRQLFQYQQAVEFFLALSRVEDAQPRQELLTLAMEFLLDKARQNGLLTELIHTSSFEAYIPQLELV